MVILYLVWSLYNIITRVGTIPVMTISGSAAQICAVIIITPNIFGLLTDDTVASITAACADAVVKCGALVTWRMIIR